MSFAGVKNFIAKHYANDAAKMFLHTGALGWIFSSAAQIFMLAHDKDLPKKEKKFLIPQESLDAAINIIAFYTVTAGVQALGKKFASSGKIIAPEIRKFCEREGLEIGKWSTNIGKSLKEEIIGLKYEIASKDKLNINLSDSDLKVLDTRLKSIEKFDDETYSPFESGIKMAGNLLGAVLSCNLITPALKNPLAAARQKRAMARDIDLKTLPASNAPILPMVPTQSRMGIDDYRKQASFNVARSGSSLKI